MDWQQQREAWNQEGLCAREACKGPLTQSWRHPTTNLLYCHRCRRLLEYNQQGLVMDQIEHWRIVYDDTGEVVFEKVQASNPCTARIIASGGCDAEMVKLRAVRAPTVLSKE